MPKLTVRAPYFSLLQPLIGSEKHRDEVLIPALAAGTMSRLPTEIPILRRTSAGLIEVYQPLTLVFPAITGRGGLVRREDATRTFLPGQALWTVWQPATTDEQVWIIAHMRDHDFPWQKSDMRKFGGQWRIRTVIAFNNIWAAARAYLRHIPRELIGFNTRTREGRLCISGEVQDMRTLRRRLGIITDNLSVVLVPTEPQVKQARVEAAEIGLALESVDEAVKQAAFQRIRAALDAPPNRIVLELDQAIHDLDQRTHNLIRMTRACSDIGLFLLNTVYKIEQGVRAAHGRLLKQAAEIEPALANAERSPQTWDSFTAYHAQQAHNTWLYLRKVCPFYPYLTAVESERGRAVLGALGDNPLRKVRRDILTTAGAIEKFVLGEVPRGEARPLRRRVT